MAARYFKSGNRRHGYGPVLFRLNQAIGFPPGDPAAHRLDRRFEPAMDDALRAEKLAVWKDAVSRTLSR